MAIFSRRSIQRMLNENAKFMSRDQLSRHVRHLNREEEDFIDVEWEIAVLNVFSKLGTVRHEPDLGGRRSIDLHFCAEANPKAYLIADIASVKDEGFEDENPREYFENELMKRVYKYNLRANSFGYAIGHYPQRSFHSKEKKKLKLPERGRFDELIFNRNFKQFLTEVSQRSNETHNYSIYTSDTELTISYNPSQRFFTSTGAAYRRAASVKSNPVYNTLKRKAAQLKDISFNGPRGIILCDGGSEMMHYQPRSSFHFDYNVSDVVKDFLRQNQSIAFVLTVTSVWGNGLTRWVYDRENRRRVETKLYPNESFHTVDVALQESLSAIEKYFPEPDNTSEGARLSIKSGYDSKKYIPYYEGLEVSSSRVKISARVILGLLAGTIDQQRFLKDYRFIPSDDGRTTMRNPFEYQLSRAARIDKITIKPSEDDDNYLTFTFAESKP